ncbi:MAG: hypothetical protein A2Z99_12305 [Treponema sp. GWB1_62_6]|nr:MAG: hypothetical protein A2Y36_10925 [Treponema sp. GWA1_62_8]OHE65511.1 MAG: hypothetical protein A2001_10300 [Treponema sp. GWC1_61_84]OHE65732.1 MAG: hypothetical protein A2Z99_12305 [Treponema sp. GWB1_62_6]OHE77097.1 MAG: hypothetical protein A2413_17270 [Treponema sp. RIFOXYC1_FULL_61_9]
MKRMLIAALALCFAAPLFARDVEAIVTADWLEANLSNPKVVVVDVRKVEEYKAAHIKGAVNVLGSSLYVPAAGLSNELPNADDLSDILADAGIDASSIVVVVESDSAARFAWATRVAWTLAWAGLDNVAVLSGGQKAWTDAKKPVDADKVAKAATKFSVKPRNEYLALLGDVLKSKGQVIDNRTYDTYFGIVKQGFVAQAGHYPNAIALPSSWIVGADGLVKSQTELAKMPVLLGLDPSVDTITYCDSGVLATGWWWILHEQLGWKNVKSYDGSSQDLTKDPSVKYVTHVWK